MDMDVVLIGLILLGLLILGSVVVAVLVRLRGGALVVGILGILLLMASIFLDGVLVFTGARGNSPYTLHGLAVVLRSFAVLLIGLGVLIQVRLARSRRAARPGPGVPPQHQHPPQGFGHPGHHQPGPFPQPDQRQWD
ncbi:hypothetical protein HJ590_08160 [Naumannella sp. ID2617S]|nr:hypothetical protein [Naumannella sp. ID2617S]